MLELADTLLKKGIKIKIGCVIFLFLFYHTSTSVIEQSKRTKYVTYFNFFIILRVVKKNYDKKSRRIENVNIGAGRYTIFQGCLPLIPKGKVLISDFVRRTLDFTVLDLLEPSLLSMSRAACFK